MKNFIKVILIATVLLFKVTSLQAEIISEKTIRDVQLQIDDVLIRQKPEDILVIIGIDMTLIQANHPAAYYPAITKYKDILADSVSRLTPEQHDLMLTLASQTTPQKLVDKEIPKMIQRNINIGVKVIGLTSSIAGKIKGYSNPLIMLKRDQMQKMGIDFTKSFKNHTRVSTFFINEHPADGYPLSEFKRYAGGYPMFYHGLLSPNGENSEITSKVIIRFLRHIGPHYTHKTFKPGYYPKTIIMVGNKRKYLEETEKSLHDYDASIQFIGIEYTAAYLYAPQDISEREFKKFWDELATQAKSLLPN